MVSVIFVTFVLVCASLSPVSGIQPTNVELSNDNELIFSPLGSQHNDSELETFLEESREDPWLFSPLADIAGELPKALMKVPWDFIEDVIKGEIDILAGFRAIVGGRFSAEEAKDIFEIVKSEALVVGVVSGFMLIAILCPFVGVTYICCRWVCCKFKNRVTVEKATKQSCCCCVCTGILLLLFSVLVLGCTAFSVTMLGLRLNKTGSYIVDEAAESIFSDAHSYINEITQGTRRIGVDDLEDVTSIMNSELDVAGVRIVAPYTAVVGTYPQTLINHLQAVETGVAALNAELSAVDSVVDTLQDATDNLTSEVSDIITELQDTKNTCQTQSFNCKFYNFDEIRSAINDIVIPLVNISEFHKFHDILDAENYTALEEQAGTYGSEQVLVDVAIDSFITDVVTELQAFNPQDVEEMLDDLLTPLDEVADSIDSLQDDLSSEKDAIDEYLGYLQYGFFGVAATIGLVVLLNIFGLVFGLCGRRVNEKPELRSRTTNCGGCCLVGSACCSMFLVSLFCIIGSLVFIIGSYLTVGCMTIEDLSFLDQVIDNPTMWDGRHMTAELFKFANMSKNDTIRVVVEECEVNGNIFNILHLNDMIDFSSVADMDQLRADVDVDSLPVLVMNAVQHIGVDGTVVLNALQNTPSATDLLSEYDSKVSAFISSEPGTSASFLLMLADDADLNTYWTANGLSTSETLTNYSLFLDGINNETSSYETDLRNVFIQFEDVLNEISDNLTVIEESLSALHDARQTLNQSSADFIDRVIGYGDDYLDHASQSISQIGQCEVVWQMYDAASVVLCEYVLDIINVIWFTFLVVAISLIITIFGGFSMYKYLTVPVDAVDVQRYSVYRTNSVNKAYQKSMNEMMAKMDPKKNPTQPTGGYSKLRDQARRLSQELPRRLSRHK